ncbi:MAG: hypothetical protein KME49_21760 [Brasilonema octagenarum HA4186-MV1]|jgi:hypothetical protein|uniref:DUF5666 domain-containing protein n=2 Tax=Brasilonema TaxID=383614 RepID=A0A856MLD9_9CYAN|nr:MULTISPECIES: hypothetical protein [Brasilonema]MBW4628062.1 hypothetical protein [Brasilonema octagenarum HA4186-MV1]NMF62986.1 hypothetical protein [Brasilonema octagenarum UFV-OR1]QDL12215.1 hypothetical protein DP114_12245 [Brasilonema sennae CENA114]QDL14914.1 hypothetical protein DP113_12180 [Brasilonema octagenarum UFV-E1]
MKLLQIALLVLILSINLVVAYPSWADETPHFSKQPDYLVGQKVVWLYKARTGSDNIQRIPGEVVKLGSKKVQVRVRKRNNEFVNRWVNRDKLENR